MRWETCKGTTPPSRSASGRRSTGAGFDTFDDVKIIALGDIHGNLPALEVCYEQAEKEGYDWIFHTGDVSGYGPFPAECAEFLHLRNIAGVRGNFDENIGQVEDRSGAIADGPAGRALAEASFEWTRRRVGAVTGRWLADLPFELRNDGDAWSLAVYHASPIDLYTALLPEMSDERFAEFGAASGADVIITGHVHRPFHRRVGGRHFINPGSVGRPGDGNPRTGYAIIETAGGLRASFPRFEYDLGRTTRAILQAGLPAEMAERLEKGL